MSLYGLRLQFPHRFNPNQTWFIGESFMDTPEPNADEPVPSLHDVGCVPDWDDGPSLPTAVALASLFLKSPHLPLWEHYIWTSDVDRHGQRIYVGVNNGLFELHRHIHITNRFAIAI